MISRRRKQLTLMDVFRIVSLYARNDAEANLAVAHLLNRGIVRFSNQGHRQRIIVR